MKRDLAFWFLAALVAGILCLTSCGVFGETGDSSDRVELRTYQVPEGHKDELRAQLRYVLRSNTDQPIGSVSSDTGNRLIVVAPPGIHEGLAEFVSQIEELGPAEAPSQVRLTYWLVLGRSAPADPGRPFEVSGPAGMKEIEPVLAGIATAQGPTEFRLLERMQLASSGQDWARTRGRVAGIGQRAAVSGDVVVAEVDVSLGRQQLQTEVVLRRDQHLVLGQAGAEDETVREAFGQGATDVTLYYVVAADF